MHKNDRYMQLGTIQASFQKRKCYFWTFPVTLVKIECSMRGAAHSGTIKRDFHAWSALYPAFWSEFGFAVTDAHSPALIRSLRAHIGPYLCFPGRISNDFEVLSLWTSLLSPEKSALDVCFNIDLLWSIQWAWIWEKCRKSALQSRIKKSKIDVFSLLAAHVFWYFFASFQCCTTAPCHQERRK